MLTNVILRGRRVELHYSSHNLSWAVIDHHQPQCIYKDTGLENVACSTKTCDLSSSDDDDDFRLRVVLDECIRASRVFLIGFLSNWIVRKKVKCSTTMLSWDGLRCQCRYSLPLSWQVFKAAFLPCVLLCAIVKGACHVNVMSPTYLRFLLFAICFAVYFQWQHCVFWIVRWLTGDPAGISGWEFARWSST